jgi:hypothetical protein
MARYPAPIHVLMARNAPIGLVIRRGPSERVATLLWNRNSDEFQLGQWLKGRIYERRSDLSPDGKHFLYFAMNGQWQAEARGSWTAISRVPFLKALAIFPKGDCWHGGGLWTGCQKFWLNDGYGHTVLRDSEQFRRDAEWHPAENYGGECLGVYYPRLVRDGWGFKETAFANDSDRRDTFEKRCRQGWILRKIAHAESSRQSSKSCYWDEHELIHPRSNQSISYPHWELADLDGERLVWAAGGKLMAGRFGSQGLEDEALLFDFNEMTFEGLEAPY